MIIPYSLKVNGAHQVYSNFITLVFLHYLSTILPLFIPHPYHPLYIELPNQNIEYEVILFLFDNLQSLYQDFQNYESLFFEKSLELSWNVSSIVKHS